ncbi:phospholipid-transporting ATPase ABCA3-like [Sorex fumeus]|uniref:phospholipid-transporting ATPase ABCA3-like n=1 Tax=Sorex fumeus TaxID=62283 RepID=UPI0024ACDB2F|nr:phospholipid-transporting ATPase ABCA3-like [Sorex fumeus]
MGVSNLDKFMILLWKNFTLKKRQFIAVATEIFIVFLIAGTVWLIRISSDIKVYGPYTYPSLDIEILPQQLRQNNPYGDWELAFVPSTSQVVTDIVENVKNYLDYNFQVKGFTSEQSLENYILKDNNHEKVLAAMVFDHEFKKSNDSLPQVVKCFLRFSTFQRNEEIEFIRLGSWKTSSLYLDSAQPGPRYFSASSGGPPGYFAEGFLAVQHALASSIRTHYLSQHPNTWFENLRISMLSARFPYRKYSHDYFFQHANIFIPLVILFIFAINQLILIKSIVWEKQNRLKEYQLLIGLSNWMLWAAYFVTYLALYLIDIFVICIIFCYKLKPKAIFQYSDPSLVFVFLLCFAFSTIFFSFMISTFFNRVYFAVSFGGFICMAFYFPSSFVTAKLGEMSFLQRLISCLSSNTAMAVGASFLVRAEKNNIGLKWSNVFEPIKIEGFHFGHVLGMLLFDGFLYGIVAWYIEAVFPGEYGVPKPWYFFVQYSYWCRENPQASTKRSQYEDTIPNPFFENEPTDLTEGIQIKNLWKEFPARNMVKVAVQNLNLNLYEGQITVLLGNNGAGKSTTLSILTGFYPATSGEAYVNGYNVSEQIVEIRKSLGLCPQQNLLFNHMTVAEQLYFYCVLKGVPRNTRSIEIDQMLSTFHLLEKSHVRAELLNGGMKRKISIIIALIGGSKVVILDEPTSGMDPASRRSTWDLLQYYKQDRTVLLTTHYMDEADALGDRIAIMVNGSLRCCGSPLFLKNIFGVGYHLVMEKEPHCNVEKVSDLINEHIPTATLESDARNELSFILPKQESQSFKELFTHLESRGEELGITGFGAYNTTMEEVFLRVNTLEDFKPFLKVSRSRAPSLVNKALKSNENMNASGNEISDTPTINESSNTSFNTGCSLFYQQFMAMLLKKVLFNWRQWKLLLVQILAFLGSPLLLFEAEKFAKLDIDSHFRELDLKQYGKTIVPLSLTGSFNFSIFVKALETILQPDNHKLIVMRGNLQTYLTENVDCIHTCIAAVAINATRTSIKVTSLFNAEAIHSPAVSLALVENVLLQLSSPASLRVFNKPQPYIYEKANIATADGLRVAIYIHFGMALLMSGFCLLSVSERVSKAKHIQFMSGVSVLVYWLSSFLWDAIIFNLIICLLLGVFKYCQVDIYVSDYRFLDTMLIFIIYGWSSIPLMYLMGFLYERPGSAYTMLSVFNYVSGIFTIIIDHIFEYGIRHVLSSPIVDFVCNAIVVFPNFNLGKCLVNYFAFYQRRILCSVRNPSASLNCEELRNVYSLNKKMIGRPLIRMVIIGFICLFLIIFLETTFWKIKIFFNKYILFGIYKACKKVKVSESLELEEEDEDVKNERNRVLTETPELLNSALILKEVIKIYFKYPVVMALKNISLSVQKGECFGLIGYTGAGKTSLFRILTEEKTVTSGEVFIDGFNITENIQKVKSKVGYCPQFDALLEYMTAREMLIMFARLWGIPEHKIRQHVTVSLNSLQLEPQADKLIKTYSGGNKRRLSAAIALIGNPSVILMDEPSTCMDPLARHMLWGIVKEACANDKTIMISSHSMEECDAICTKLAILVKGRIVCLGSPQHLKSKFGNIYVLKVKVKSEARDQMMEEFKDFIETTFPGSELKQETQGILNYYIPKKDTSWGKLVDILENAKDQYSLEDYSISQMTLEQIFLNFAVPEETNDEKERRMNLSTLELPATSACPAERPRQISSNLVCYYWIVSVGEFQEIQNVKLDVEFMFQKNGDLGFKQVYNTSMEEFYFEEQGFASEKDFEEYVTEGDNHKKVLAAIIFEDKFSNNEVPNKVVRAEGFGGALPLRHASDDCSSDASALSPGSSSVDIRLGVTSILVQVPG